MSQRWIPAAFARGGTSKGLFFHDRDLPAAGPERDAVFLSALGSPDPYGRQLDGMGGGISSLSKVIVVRTTDHPDAEVEYTFGQVDVRTAVVDHSANCGNLSAAVGPFAVDEGLVDVSDGPVTIRIFNTNTGKLLHAAFTVRDGAAEVDGPMKLPGVTGTGSPIELKYLDPAGSRTGRLLPTGSAAEHLRTASGDYRVSLVDAANPMVFVAAGDVGLVATETPDEIEARAEIMARLDDIRRAAAVAMGMCESASSAPLAAPKVAAVGPPAAYSTLDGEVIAEDATDLLIRVVSMGQLHRALPGTAALCCAVACQVPGSVLGELVPAPHSGTVRLGSPSGPVTAAAEVAQDGDSGVQARSASLYRTARMLMRGAVAVR
ncbi:hypothetical protein HUO13_15830 [Saccharopolyspora erythraea]|uniref:2-methylaconitate cis-trans isomerase PrpF family protein n=1 Tax=Saccharopolyspora erythraea TaxID=1836 RepID=UPI001BAA46D1|nr:PrpF domain-containing protein [Saccharopolyspora erythraea]QUH02074.1 hypothetical protein HUO13_15830 [Saccharopolyspora erythraea]